MAYPSSPFLHTIAPFSDNDFTDVVDLPAGVSDIKSVQPGMWPPTATSKQLQTSLASKWLQWLQMLRCQATDANGSEMDQDADK